MCEVPFQNNHDLPAETASCASATSLTGLTVRWSASPRRYRSGGLQFLDAASLAQHSSTPATAPGRTRVVLSIALAFSFNYGTTMRGVPRPGYLSPRRSTVHVNQGKGHAVVHACHRCPDIVNVMVPASPQPEAPLIEQLVVVPGASAWGADHARSQRGPWPHHDVGGDSDCGDEPRERRPDGPPRGIVGRQHHNGAVEMSTTEVEAGHDTDAIALAREILTPSRPRFGP